METKLRASEEERKQHERRAEQLSKEMERLEREWDQTLKPIETDNKKLKNDIESIKKQIDEGQDTIRTMRERQVDFENELQRINRDINELRNRIRSSEDDNSLKVRQLVDGFRSEKLELERRVEDAKHRLIAKERQLEQNEQELNILKRDYQKLVEGLKSNLANTINSTLNDYKGPKNYGYNPNKY